MSTQLYVTCLRRERERAPTRDHLLLVLCGLPGAGKTTTARIAARIASSRGWDARHLEFDDCFVMEGDDVSDTVSWRDPVEWQKCVNAYHEAVERETAVANSTKKIVIVDDNSYYKSMRKWYYKCVERHSGWTYVEVFFRAGLEVAMRRNETREPARRVPRVVIETMARRIEFHPRAKIVLDIPPEYTAETAAELILERLSE